MYYAVRGTGQSAGAMATQIDNILGCGDSGIMEKARVRRAKRSLMLAWEFRNRGIFALEVKRKVSTGDSQLLPTYADLWYQRQRGLGRRGHQNK